MLARKVLCCAFALGAFMHDATHMGAASLYCNDLDAKKLALADFPYTYQADFNEALLQILHLRRTGVK